MRSLLHLTPFHFSFRVDKLGFGCRYPPYTVRSSLPSRLPLISLTPLPPPGPQANAGTHAIAPAAPVRESTVVEVGVVALSHACRRRLGLADSWGYFVHLAVLAERACRDFRRVEARRVGCTELAGRWGVVDVDGGDNLYQLLSEDLYIHIRML